MYSCVFTAFYMHFTELMTSFLFREPLPGSWDTDLDDFQKILVLRCLRADKVTNAMQVRKRWKMNQNESLLSFSSFFTHSPHHSIHRTTPFHSMHHFHSIHRTIPFTVPLHPIHCTTPFHSLHHYKRLYLNACTAHDSIRLY